MAALERVIHREGERKGLPQKAFEQVIGVRDRKILGVPQSVLQPAYRMFCVSAFTKYAHTDTELPAFLLPLIDCTFIT